MANVDTSLSITICKDSMKIASKLILSAGEDTLWIMLSELEKYSKFNHKTDFTNQEEITILPVTPKNPYSMELGQRVCQRLNKNSHSLSCSRKPIRSRTPKAQCQPKVPMIQRGSASACQKREEGEESTHRKEKSVSTRSTNQRRSQSGRNFPPVNSPHLLLTEEIKEVSQRA